MVDISVPIVIYRLQSIGEEGDCYIYNQAPNEVSFLYEEESKICSRCGGEKYAYDDYCMDCIDELENTCSRCGAYAYGVYGGLCSICQEDLDEDVW